MRGKSTYGVGRHDFMTALYTEAGKHLGLSEDVAGAAAITVATGIAIFKNKGYNPAKARTSKSSTSSPSSSRRKPKAEVEATGYTLEELQQAGEFVVINGFGVLVLPNGEGRLYLQGKDGKFYKTTITEKPGRWRYKYDKVFNTELGGIIQKTVQSITPDLYASRKLFEVYRKLRDQLGL